MEEDGEYEISVTDASVHDAARDALLVKAIAATLDRHDTRRARIDVAVVGDAAITRLNLAHLDCPRPTDVLSFDLRDTDGLCGQGHADTRPIDGEIVVSVDTAVREARKRRHHADAELTLYVVHGTLHLLGYTDEDQSAARRMHGLEDAILASLGLGAVFRRGNGEGDRGGSLNRPLRTGEQGCAAACGATA